MLIRSWRRLTSARELNSSCGGIEKVGDQKDHGFAALHTIEVVECGLMIGAARFGAEEQNVANDTQNVPSAFLGGDVVFDRSV